VQRLKLSDLPATVGLDDTMAMVDGMDLSSFERVIVSARITRSGSAITQSGDYIGSRKVDDVKQMPTISIEIDELVP
jgi:cytochrome c-type biogenesis protein CcmH